MQWTTYVTLLLMIMVTSLFITWDDISFHKSIKKPIAKYTSTDPIDYNEPYQDAASLTEINSFKINDDKQNITLQPKAVYEISGLLIGKNTNFGIRKFNWAFDRIAPIDYAIAWGEYANKEFIENNYTISLEKDFSNGGRVVYADAKTSDSEDLLKYSITHIIPANNNILNATMSAKKYDEVYLTGVLVNIIINNKIINETSLSRLDNGVGAGEIMYVTEIRINDKIYD